MQRNINMKVPPPPLVWSKEDIGKQEMKQTKLKYQVLDEAEVKHNTSSDESVVVFFFVEAINSVQ